MEKNKFEQNMCGELVSTEQKEEKKKILRKMEMSKQTNFQQNTL